MHSCSTPFLSSLIVCLQERIFGKELQFMHLVLAVPAFSRCQSSLHFLSALPLDLFHGPRIRSVPRASISPQRNTPNRMPLQIVRISGHFDWRAFRLHRARGGLPPHRGDVARGRGNASAHHLRLRRLLSAFSDCHDNHRYCRPFSAHPSSAR